MPQTPQTSEADNVLVGWQGVTAQIPRNWNLGAISGDQAGGYVRYDDETMPRLEIKWAAEKGYVDLSAVIDKYLRDIQKGRKKGAPELEIDRDVKLISKRKRKKAGLKCFHWKAEMEGYGAAWLCKDCGRTVIAQMMLPADQKPDEALELVSSVLLSIEDHPEGDSTLWSAYDLHAYIPNEFKLTGQKLMAGLIEIDFELETEKIKVARWGMANVALKRRPLKDWASTELGKQLRKHGALPEEVPIHGHEGLNIEGSAIAGVQLIQRFWQHCRDQRYADRLIARLWHCEPSNSLHYVETFVDRVNTSLADEIAARIACHPGAGTGAGGGAQHDEP